ncbi:hypothetical protein C0989_002120 [Termitomyces sp. Mn162]|nr:hypothetical protein C0989_002120 [Termitomyces sp. Mn162]
MSVTEGKIKSLRVVLGLFITYQILRVKTLVFRNLLGRWFTPESSAVVHGRAQRESPMATTRQDPASPARFSWFTFGLGSRSANASADRAHETELGDPWFIPYSGPVEPPREPFRRRLERDSWGDPIIRAEEEDTTNVHKSYEVGSDFRHPFATDSRAPGVGDNNFYTGRRARTQSMVSDRTVPSDPSQASIRRLTITSPRLPAPLLVSGGIGESPMPPPTHQKTASKERISIGIADFFSFGGQTRKRTSELHIPPKIYTKTKSDQRSSRSGSAGVRRSSSTESDSFWGQRNLGNTKVAGIDEHHHASYHLTNACQKTRSNVNNQSSSHPYNSTSRRQQQLSTVSVSESNTRHPFSYVFPPTLEDNGPRTAPSLSTDPIASSTTHVVTHITNVTGQGALLQNTTSIIPVQKGLPLPFSDPEEIKGLRNSASTPNLRNAFVPRLSSQFPSKMSPTTKIKERLLSVETWCDALLFPRPRLKMKQAGCDTEGERIVSLPPSPVNQSGQITAVPAAFEQSVASRVLAHSRSLADFEKVRKNRPITEPEPSSSLTGLQPRINASIQMNRPHRPKNRALDDLVLPSPIPSLAQVIEEGEKFRNQRKQWQNQAAKSFQNKRTRSISRIRSKSLTHKEWKNDGGRPSNIDFLAAKACLGSQILSPVVVEHRCKSSQITSFGTGLPTRNSHFHSSSLAMAQSKSSKSHIRGQPRSGSLGRVVLEASKDIQRDNPFGRDFFTNDELENVLRGDSTKMIRLADPVLAPNPILGQNSPMSPRSLVNDARVGIALTTPPSVDDPHGVKAMRLPSHPYAQGGLYSFGPAHSEPRVPDHDGRDPLVEDLSAKANISSMSRGTGGPVITSSYHPYAQQSSSRDSYFPDAKYTHSDIPAPSKMWAQLSSGIITGVHPDDIQYSPLMSQNAHEPENVDDLIRNSGVINDTVNIGEALAFAVSPRSSKDSGLGTSEEHATANPSYQISVQAAKESVRHLVQYDTTRPTHLPLQPTDHDSAHTFASSPLLHQPQSAPDMVHNTTPLMVVTQTRALPENMSRRSLRSISDPDDLEGFYDLFYDPNRPIQHLASQVNYASVSGTSRAESELASLARQLSEELEQMTLEQGGGQYWRSSMEEFPSSIARKATGSTLEFIFEETASPGLGSTGLFPPGQHTFSPFQASSVKIPEDVELSRASSLIELEKDVNFIESRAGVMESTSIHTIVDEEARASLIDHMPSPVERKRYVNDETLSERENCGQLRTNSGLQPSLVDPTRSSSATSSTMSRMSTLSDFPAPPQRHAVERMSLITSYFDEAPLLSELRASCTVTSPAILAPLDNANMGHSDEQSSDEDMEELVAALSSHSHSTSRH